MAEEGQGSNPPPPPPAGINPRKSLKYLLRPARSNAASAVVLPIEANQFNFKPGVIQLLPSFSWPRKRKLVFAYQGF